MSNLEVNALCEGRLGLRLRNLTLGDCAGLLQLHYVKLRGGAAVNGLIWQSVPSALGKELVKLEIQDPGGLFSATIFLWSRCQLSV